MLYSILLENKWTVAPDPENVGKLPGSGYPDAPRPDAVPVPVPGILQQALPDYHGVVWYYYTLQNPFKGEYDRRHLLCFGAVDYYCDVYADGNLLFSNEGPEKPFSVDVTEALKDKDAVLLALRVINPPAAYVLEGFERTKIPRRNIEGDRYRGGACYNAGGITQPVTLKSVPLCRITDVFVRPDSHTGHLPMTVSLENMTEARRAHIRLSVRLTGDPAPVVDTAFDVSLAYGVSDIALSADVPSPLLWSCDDPKLYDVCLTMETETGICDSHTVTVGFRDFHVEKGFFYLNGKRLFLKSAHTGNCFPGGVVTPTIPGMEFKDFQLAKAAGFNCIRFIATCATPAQLDYCDRLGLMVYEESYASWYLGDSPRAKELFYDSIFSMIRRDRNHACVTIWGMLNETGPFDDVFTVAKNILPDLRRIDDTRLVLFNSGRFDLNNPYENYTPDFSLGSFSNPGTEEWQCEWGSEGKPDCPPLAGDVHGYMGVPLLSASVAANRFRGMEDGKSGPVFISETGVGSQADVITTCKQLAQHGVSERNPDYSVMKEIADAYVRDFYRFGADTAYADPEDFLYDSNRYNGETRRMCFDVIRSNPRFCGYNVTGLLDHYLTGEGPFTLFREYKPTNFDAFADGFAPLRFCLFTSKGNVYAGAPLELEAVLANEDVLPDGTYQADFAVTDACGRPVWKHSVTFTLPILDREGLPALAFPLMKETVRLHVPAGKYCFKAYLKNGGAPGASVKEFYVSEPIPSVSPARTVYLYSADKFRDFLCQKGFVVRTVTDLSDPLLPQNAKLLVGALAPETALVDAEKLLSLAESGADVTFLDPLTFDDTSPAAPALDLPNKTLFGFPAWVYHKDVIVKPDPVTEGLPTGFATWEIFDASYPHITIISDRVPDESPVVFFAVGNFEWVTGRNEGMYHAGANIGRYNRGKGAFTINTFRLAEELGSCPAGDRILINLAQR